MKIIHLPYDIGSYTYHSQEMQIKDRDDYLGSPEPMRNSSSRWQLPSDGAFTGVVYFIIAN